jgi:hypothetical protein
MDAHLEQNKLARTRKTARGAVGVGGGEGDKSTVMFPEDPMITENWFVSF